MGMAEQMTAPQALREMRRVLSGGYGMVLNAWVSRWADALEAAMTTPVAEVRETRGVRLCAFDPDLPPGTKLYTFEPDAAREIARLTNGLHQVSLASQNSMSSKEECGRIARKTLDAETKAAAS